MSETVKHLEPPSGSPGSRVSLRPVLGKSSSDPAFSGEQRVFRFEWADRQANESIESTAVSGTAPIEIETDA